MACDYLSMLGLKLNHVSKIGHMLLVVMITSRSIPTNHAYTEQLGTLKSYKNVNLNTSSFVC